MYLTNVLTKSLGEETKCFHLEKPSPVPSALLKLFFFFFMCVKSINNYIVTSYMSRDLFIQILFV